MRTPIAIILFLLLPLNLAPLFAQDASAQTEGDPEPIKVKAGIYVLNVYDINTSSGTFGADIWIWYTHKPSADLDLFKSREVLNAKDYKVITSDVEEKNGLTWGAEKIQATLVQNFDISKFPYDRHELKIIIEESVMEISELQFVPDLKNSKIDESAQDLEGWKVVDFKVETNEHAYTSNFGDPTTEEGSSYHQLVATMTIERNAHSLMIKIVMGLYIAFAVAVIAFFMKTSSDDIFASRVGLLVGMVFATLLSKEAAESVVGQSASATLSDKLHNLGFVYLFSMICLTLLSRRLSENGKEERAVLFDRISVIVLIGSFAIINWILIKN